MSKQAEIEIQCEQCGSKQTFKIWESLNATLDPERKKELMAGKLALFVCKKCQRSSQVLHPLLYHDMEKHLMVWLRLAPNDLTDEELRAFRLIRGYKYRLVSSFQELLEKILIFDKGLDDRMVELYKLRLISEFEKEPGPRTGTIYFLNIGKSDEEGDVMELVYKHEKDYRPFDMKMKSYQEFVEIISNKIPDLQTELDKWVRVDQQYAASLIVRSS